MIKLKVLFYLSIFAAPMAYAMEQSDPIILGKLLLNAARNGNTEQVKHLINQGADLNQKSEIDLGGTSWASTKGIIRQMLMEKDIDELCKEVNYEDYTPLMLAAKNGHTEIARLLIESGADVHLQTYHFCRTPLHFAACNGHTEIVLTLIKNGADINQSHQFDGYTPLMLAVKNGHMKTVEMLIANGALLNKGDWYRRTELMFVCYDQPSQDRTKIAQILIDNGANVNQLDSTECGALYYAAIHGQTEIAQMLIINGANVNQKNPLHLAVLNDNTEIVQMLINAGADLNKKNDNVDGYSPLQRAAYDGRREIAQILINAGADILQESKYGNTPLILAAQNNHRTVCQLITETLINAERKRAVTILLCLKQIFKIHYSNAKHIFTPYLNLRGMIEDARLNAVAQINRIKNEEIKKELLAQYGAQLGIEKK